MNLDFVQGDAKWKSFRTKAKRNFYWFAAVVLNYGDLIPMREGPHALLARFLSRTTGIPELDTCKYRKIEMPRETGKTTLGSQAYVIWRLIQDPNMSILLCNEKAENAEAFLSAIKQEFENNEFLRALFPGIIPPDFAKTTWKASAITVQRDTRRKEPSVFTIGLGGTVTGMHPDEIIVDDLISREAMEAARRGNLQIMEQANRWINQLEPLLSSNAQPAPSITFIGTRWWMGDVYEHVETAFGYGERPVIFNLRWKLENGSTQIVPVTKIGELAVFRRAAIENGQSIFPEKWDLERLAKIRVRDPALFSCNYMNNPTSDDVSTFKTGWLRYFQWIDSQQIEFDDGVEKHTALVSGLDVVILVDPGGFSAKGTEDRARAAIIVTGRKDGRVFLLDCWSEKDSYKVAAAKVSEFVGRYYARKVKIEQAAQQLAFIDLCKGNVQKAGYVVSWETVTPGVKSKDDRIYELEPFFERGLVYIGTGPRFHELTLQYQQFPRGTRKDMLDALSQGPAEWRKHHMRTQTPEERRANELAQYRVKRGLAPARMTMPKKNRFDSEDPRPDWLVAKINRSRRPNANQ